MPHRLIGEILVQDLGISREFITEALEYQKERGGRVGEILIRQARLSEVNLLKALSKQFGLTFCSTLPVEEINTDFTRIIPIQYLKRYRMVPFETGDGMTVAINDPLLFQGVDDLRIILDQDDVKTVLATHAAILSAINTAYDQSQDTAQQFVEEMHNGESDRIISEIEQTVDLLDDTSDAPVIRLVNLILSQAIKSRASDIHIEPYQNVLKIRFRIDGILYNILTPPKRIQPALISRIKVMAKMNIAEKRLPQDSRILVKIADRNIDIRVSTIPTQFGERVVLRLLDKSNILLNLSDLGMSEANLSVLDRLIRSSYGIILVTGPTGSGKTTTLYAALSAINHPDINIITIEDPIEYQIEGIGQIQVNPKINLTFANGLRSIVRQDPDVILVGEIRDLETAEIAIQSSLTGHLVFSTLHTNDAASAVTRLIDMGIEPFLVTSSVITVIAQRLVRVICPDCKEEYSPDKSLLEEMGIDPDMLFGRTLFRGRGCDSCFHTGYKGRTGVFELMLITDEIKNVILKTSDANRIKQEAIRSGMITLRQAGIQKALMGVTTIEEVLRVT